MSRCHRAVQIISPSYVPQFVLYFYLSGNSVLHSFVCHKVACFRQYMRVINNKMSYYLVVVQYRSSVQVMGLPTEC